MGVATGFTAVALKKHAQCIASAARIQHGADRRGENMQLGN